MSEPTLEDVLAELDAEVQKLEELPYPEVRDRIFHVLQLIDRAHRPGLEALAAILRQAGSWEQALDDDGARILLTLYGLAPVDERTQAEIALEAVRPYVRSHGGEIEVLRVEDGEVHIRLRGTCGSCAASSATLERGVRAALQEGFPGFRKLVAYAPADADGPSRESLVELRGPAFRDLLALDELDDRVPRTIAADGIRAVLVRAGDDVYAYDPTCAACGGALDGARVDRDVLVCPQGSCAFDLGSGRRVSGEAGAGLRNYPVTVRSGRVLLADGFEPAALFETL